ncbi:MULTISPECIES: hypothetical protein [Pseudomonas]|uniref:hypothetical protein n=1 Tax=Pseudomonas TaxID=286 RepID=UPI0011C073B5|nr:MULTISPECIES: hypothetical protein [Pseudomonas]
MSKIDWSKAPEWAIHVGETKTGHTCWIGEDYYGYVGKEPQYYDLAKSPSSPGHRSLREFEILASRPVPEPWSGEGVPPVGTVVEIQRGGWTIREESAEFIGAEVTVCAVFQTARGADMIAVDGGADLGCEVFRAEMARPVPTPEEKAEAERVAGLNEMIRHMKDHPGGTHGVSHMQQLMIHEDVARDLWAAGYRKQIAP